MAIPNATDMKQPLTLTVEVNGQNPTLNSSFVESAPTSLTLPRFGVSIYEFPVK